MTETNPETFAAAVDTIERAYEFMLAYAAQGRETEGTSTDGKGIRDQLIAMNDALKQLSSIVSDKIEDHVAEASREVMVAYRKQLEQDATVAACTINAVLSVPSISSQLIDNLNASIHVRTLLTDLFLVDELLKAHRKAAS